jgi:PAS domain S-box-containing protein
MIQVLVKNPKAALNRAVAAMFGCFVLWSLGNTVMLSSLGSEEVQQHFAKYCSIGNFGFVTFYILFILSFTENKRVLKAPLLYVIIFTVPCLLVYSHWTGQLTTCCLQTPYGITEQWKHTFWLYLFYVYYISVICWGIYLLYDYRKKQTDSIKKRVTNILIISVTLSFILGTLTSVVIKEMGMYIPFEGNFVILIFAYSIMYAIQKYEFLAITPSRAADNLVGMMEDGFVLLNKDGTIAKVNNSASGIFGCRADDMEGLKSAFDSMLPDLFGRIRSGEQIDKLEITFNNSQGKEMAVIMSCSTLSEKNEVYGYVCIIKNVTDQRLMQKEFSNSQERFADLIQNITDWIWEIDENGIFIYSSPGILQLLGYKPEEILGKSFYVIMPRKEAQVFRELMEKISADKIPVNGHVIVSYHKDNGKRVLFETNCIAVTGENGVFKGVRCASRDLSERKLAEENIKKTLENLRNSNLELERFAYVVSHDLKEPLRMVTNYLYLLKKYGNKLDDNANEFINFAVEGSGRMAELINDLLEYSRVKIGEESFESTDLNEVTDDVLSILKYSIKDSFAVIEIPAKLPSVYADRMHMSQLFQNLIGNSIKFRKKDMPPKITIGFEKKADEWLFSISDNGIGIEEKDKEKIFEIFQRINPRSEYEGSGIGLAISKKIIERHHGKIWVESEGKDKGTKMCFTIPAGQ